MCLALDELFVLIEPVCSDPENFTSGVSQITYDSFCDPDLYFFGGPNNQLQMEIDAWIPTACYTGLFVINTATNSMCGDNLNSN
jgi:hypothetical protein